MSVSTYACNSLIPSSATFILTDPSNVNGFVTTPTVKIPMSFAIFAMIGAAPLPVPPPIPAATKAM